MKALISYDLRQPGRNYASLYTAIKGLGQAYHPLESTWIVITSLSSCAQVRDALLPHIDRNDGLLVVGLSGDWATYGVQAAGLSA